MSLALPYNLDLGQPTALFPYSLKAAAPSPSLAVDQDLDKNSVLPFDCGFSAVDRSGLENGRLPFFF